MQAWAIPAVRKSTDPHCGPLICCLATRGALGAGARFVCGVWAFVAEPRCEVWRVGEGGGAEGGGIANISDWQKLTRGKVGRLEASVGPHGVGRGGGGGRFPTWKVSQLHSLSIVPNIDPGLLSC